MHVPQDSLSLLPCCEHPLLLTFCPLPATCTRDTFLAQDAALHGQKQGRAPQCFCTQPSRGCWRAPGAGGTECGAVREPRPGRETCKELGFARPLHFLFSVLSRWW